MLIGAYVLKRVLFVDQGEQRVLLATRAVPRDEMSQRALFPLSDDNVHLFVALLFFIDAKTSISVNPKRYAKSKYVFTKRN